MTKKIVIIGAGASGLLVALRLIEFLEGKVQVIIIEKGKEYNKRKCKGDKSCKKCFVCDKVEGVGGAGLFSDGKIVDDWRLRQKTYIPLDGRIVRTHYFNNFQLKRNELKEAIKWTFRNFLLDLDKEILNNTLTLEQESNEIENKLKDNGFEISKVGIKHLGTEGCQKVISTLWKKLFSKEGIRVYTEMEVINIQKKRNKWILKILHKGKVLNYTSDIIVIATGKSSYIWLTKVLDSLRISYSWLYMDLGIRIEFPREYGLKLLQLSLDPKIRYIGKYNDPVRTFCFCDGGYLYPYKCGDIFIVGGHSYKNKKSLWSNFAVLVRVREEFPGFLKNNLRKYIYQTNGMQNVIAAQDARSFIQNSGPISLDLARTSIKNFAIPMRISNVIHKRIYEQIRDFLLLLSKIVPNIITYGAIFAPSVEWINPKIKMSGKLEAKKNLFIIGDATGIGQGLVCAGISAYIVANEIIKRF